MFTQVLVHGGVERLAEQEHSHPVAREAKRERQMLLAFPFLSPYSIKLPLSPLTR